MKLKIYYKIYRNPYIERGSNNKTILSKGLHLMTWFSIRVKIQRTMYRGVPSYTI